MKQMEPELLLEEYRALLETADQLPLTVTGSSMTPFLVHGRDTVYLSKADRPLGRGDIVLYRRINGDYILHRICAVEGECFATVGDAQTRIEHGVTAGQILAVVSSASRKNKRQAPGCFWWDFFAHIWIRWIPIRPYLMTGYRRITGLFRRKK